MKVTAIAPTNIAVVKYWGKHEVWEKYHIPNKSSLSFTVDGLQTMTTLEVQQGSGKISFILNGREIKPDDKEFEYVDKYLKKLFELFPQTKNYDYKIVSENNFPTAAGYASSASGFAAFAKALQGAMKVLEPEIYQQYMADDKKLSVFARLGSGSATRSIPERGGFVAWWRGISPNFVLPPDEASEQTRQHVIFSSYAESLFPPEHWPELRIIYTHVKKSEKKVKSRAGMKMTVKTNPLYYDWIEYEEGIVVPDMIDAVKTHDFERFADLVMHCSNGLHAAMLYTTPRIVYLNDVSHQIIDTILQLNENEIKAAYTFDAGPNAIVFTLEKYLSEVKSVLAEIVGEENIFITKPGKGPKILEVKE